MLNVFFNFKYWYKRIMKHLLHNPFASSLEYSAKAECSSYMLLLCTGGTIKSNRNGSPFSFDAV